nr:efflux RND transporter periplasmic adaptor subunit [Lachnospiraceae bacterium]
MEENRTTENSVEFPEIDLKIEDKTKKKKGKIKPWIIVTIAACVLIVVLFGVMIAKMSSAMAGMGTPVEVKEAFRGNIAQTVEASGVVASEEVKTYFADVTAKIDQLSVVQGQPVKKGDLLVTYHTEDLEDGLSQAELETKISTYGADAAIVGIDSAEKKAANAAAEYENAKKFVAHYSDCVAQANAQLKKATKLATEQAELAAQIQKLTKALTSNPEDKASAKALKSAEKDYKKVSKELKKYDIDALKETLENCSADLAEYKALMKEYELTKEGDPAAALNRAQQSMMKESAQVAKNQAADQLATAREGVKADFDGIVSDVVAVEGQMATEGVQLFTIHNANALKVTLSVTKYDVQKLAVGQAAEITINENEYTGSVSSISRIASVNGSGAAVVDVTVHIDNPDDKIILGMEAKVSVQTAEEEDILLIPSAGVNYSSDGIFCYILSDGVIEKREIETGISDDEYIQVLSGLKEGDKVVTNVTGTIEEGMPASEMPASALTGEDAEETEE